MALTVLKSATGRAAAKRFSLDAAGVIQKTAAEFSRRYWCRAVAFCDVFELYKILRDLEDERESLVVRGQPISDFSKPVRRIKYHQDGEESPFRCGADWLCFDFDHVQCPDHIDPVSGPDAAMTYLRGLLPAQLQNVTCVWQWSNSAGMDGWKMLKAHLWFVLDDSEDDDVIRAWARDRAAPVDLSLFNTVQPHFTARPIFEGMADPIMTRTGLLLGDRDVVDIDFRETNKAKPTMTVLAGRPILRVAYEVAAR